MARAVNITFRRFVVDSGGTITECVYTATRSRRGRWGYTLHIMA